MQFALLAAALSAAAPLIALGSETWPGLAPCALCLWQRWPYWVAAAIAVVAAFLPEEARRWALRASAVAVLVSGAIAFLHVGVEFKFWPSPLPACQAATAGPTATVEDLMRSLAPGANKPCDEPAFFFDFLPFSIAEMNLVYALCLAIFIWRGTLAPKPRG
ncbi:disulfide bond formation protein B [Falsiroseomonas sp. HW251]|uniref:disulfide bond formation protein B n=1 Tax=Falsiroseomonas sp. HW251 TaxID=3390998 RepID=UPI003D31D128